MNARIPSQSLPLQALTTVFVSGNSQAVRLPKAFRFSTKQVTIERRGDEIVLREKKRTLGQTLRDALADIPPLSAKETIELEKALATIKDQGALEARAMWADPDFWRNTAPTKLSGTRKTPKSTRPQSRKNRGQK
jgi:antitoxin VapB